jgi:8-oxo-dGTP pyrophosphatase MutT (NUDIX family)
MRGMGERPSLAGALPDVEIAKMSGTLVLEHRRVLVEVCGEARWERVLARMTPEARREYDQITPMSWPTVAVAEAAMRAAAEELGRDVAALHEEISRASVERALTTLWRLLLRFTSDEALVARTPRIYARALNRGELVPRIVAPGRAEIRVVGWPDIPEFSLRGVRIAIESVLRLSHRHDVRVVTELTPEGPRFIATWRT